MTFIVDVFAPCKHLHQAEHSVWGLILCPFVQLKKTAQLGPIQEKNRMCRKGEKMCADGVISKMEGKLIFTLSQFLCAVGHNTGDILDFGEKKSHKREISNTLGLLGKSVLKMCTFASNPAPPTVLCFLAPHPVAHVTYAFSVKTAFL